MNCTICNNKATMTGFCKDHFFEYFDNKVKQAIQDFDLIQENDKICVAVSGGKDSVVLLYVLKKLGYDVSGLAIDEGIEGYRAGTLEFLKKFCSDLNVPLVIESFKDEVGKNLDDVVEKGKSACTICGTFRRFLLNKYSRNFDKVATGHNLDDEAQAVMMNLLKAQTELFDRQGPKTREAKGFTQKIKPLYYLKEKEILAYAYLRGFDVPFVECPYAHLSFRSKVRDFINKEEAISPGVKENVIHRFLELKRKSDDEIITNTCIICKFPSEGEICRACRLKEEINKK